MKRKDDARAFIESHIEKLPDSPGCWLWTDITNHFGYGIIYIGGKLERAHRLSHKIYNNGNLDQLVLHKCDVPSCVNPNHLYSGTHANNIKDINKRGRRNDEQGSRPYRRSKTCKRGHDKITGNIGYNGKCLKCRMLGYWKKKKELKNAQII